MSGAEARAPRRRRRFFAPEVVQTSAMDCGPASLKCILEGFGVAVSYGRLREACQTDVDGTSIDVIEEVAVQLGLDAEQVMLPLDHVLLDEVGAMPAIVVWRNPDGAPHFVILWRKAFGRVMVMDPATGRRWMTERELRASLYEHRMPIPADVFRAYADSEEFRGALAARFAALDARSVGEALVARCSEDPSWLGFATLDAALRMVTTLVRSGAIGSGDVAGALVQSLFEQGVRDAAAGAFGATVPSTYFTASQAAAAADGAPQVLLSGAVLVRVHGVRGEATSAEEGEHAPLSPELEAALREAPLHPLRELGAMLRADGFFQPIAIAAAIAAASVGAALEALLLRGLLDIGRRLGPLEQRLGAIVVLLLLFVALLGLELTSAGGMLRLGRRLEARLRAAFLAKIPRLSDRYFHSRPTSDMAHRAHAMHPVRQLPSMGGRLLRSVMDLLVTAAGLVWIAPHAWPVVAIAVTLAVALPWVTQASMVERDLRVRAFDGSLMRFYLDALLGLFAIRTHGAERALRREHGAMLADWRRAAYDRSRAAVTIDGVEQVVGFVLAVWLTFTYLARTPEPAAVLLLLYWALNVPPLGQEIASSARAYPAVRNLMLRLLEPLGALDETDEAPAPPPVDADATMRLTRSVAGLGAHLVFRGVSVRAAGRAILEGVHLTVAPGEHVAIVGPSGAGKSSLVGLLLGWHRPAAGEVLVDGEPLRGERLRALRNESAWIDPAVQLWNRTLLANLEYGATGDRRVGRVLDDADLKGLLERLPDGLQTELGEGGALVSGGEGQRVRLGRAMMRPSSRLVVLDEPFRGLDRERRRALLTRARRLWRETTLLCVTHDVGETLGFDRVLVVEDGAIVEDGAPDALRARPASRYRALLEAEDDVRERLWTGAVWRRLEVRDGTLREEAQDATKEGAT